MSRFVSRFLQVFPAIIIPPLLHTHLSMFPKVSNIPYWAVHYHTLIPNILFGSITKYGNLFKFYFYIYINILKILFLSSEIHTSSPFQMSVNDLVNKYLPLPYTKIKGLWPDTGVSGLRDVPEQYTNNWVIPTAWQAFFSVLSFIEKECCLIADTSFSISYGTHCLLFPKSYTIVGLGIILTTFNH